MINSALINWKGKIGHTSDDRIGGSPATIVVKSDKTGNEVVFNRGGNEEDGGGEYAVYDSDCGCRVFCKVDLEAYYYNLREGRN